MAANNPMRFIDDLVDDLDLSEAGFLRSRLFYGHDSRSTKRPGYDPKVIIGYNAQVAVDAKHSLIIECQVTRPATT